MFKGPFIHILLIIILGLLAYSNTFNVPFHFDDTPNIVENNKIKDISNFWPPSGSRWFGFLTFALNYHFGGLKTFGYHIFNLLIHILNAILVYWLVVLTFRTPYFKVSVISASVSNQPNQFNLSTFKPLNYLPLFIALLFVSHPIQTQAVTYIVQRFTSLATFFYILSLVMYIKFRSRQSAVSNQQSAPHPSLPLEGGGQGRGWRLHATRYTLYAVSLISAILAMKTKEIAFTLPLIITLYEFMFFEGKIKKRILYLIPLILTMLIIPLSLVGIDKPISDAIGELREAVQEIEQISRLSYLFTQFRVIVTYIRLLFLPINQNLDYDYPTYHSFFNPNVFLSFLFLLSIFGLGIYLLYRSRISHPEPKAKGLRDSSALPQTCPERKACPEHERRNEILPLNQVQGQNDRKRRNDIKSPTRYTLYASRFLAFGIFWFFITLSVESSIIPIRDVINEHRLYLPSVGAIIAFSITIFYVLQFIVHRFRVFTSYFLLLSTIILVLSITTYQRNIVWKDEVSLWEDVVKKSPYKARGHNNLGLAYMEDGRLEEAIEHYRTAILLKPDYANANYNLGLAFRARGLLDEAIKHFQTAMKLNINDAEAHNELGVAYGMKGEFNKALEHFQIALRLDPQNAYAYRNIGTVYEKMGLLEDAIKEYHIALRLNPELKVARDNLNRLLQTKKK